MGPVSRSSGRRFSEDLDLLVVGDYAANRAVERTLKVDGPSRGVNGAQPTGRRKTRRTAGKVVIAAPTSPHRRRTPCTRRNSRPARDNYEGPPAHGPHPVVRTTSPRRQPCVPRTVRRGPPPERPDRDVGLVNRHDRHSSSFGFRASSESGPGRLPFHSQVAPAGSCTVRLTRLKRLARPIITTTAARWPSLR